MNANASDTVDVAASITRSTPARVALALEVPLLRVLEAFAALLVVSNVAVLLVGVISRFYFHHPLVFAEELAQTIFLWLGMIGSVVALSRGVHMRMTTLRDMAPARSHVWIDGYGSAMGLLFLAAVIRPSVEYVFEVSGMTMPGLDISKSWLTAPLPIGFALMMVVAILRLFRTLPVTAAVLLVIASGLVAWGAPMAEPWLERYGNVNLLLFFVGLLGCSVLAGVPIAIAFSAATLAYMVFATDVPTMLFVGRFYEGMSHLILMAIPLFVLLGLLIEMTGMARAIIEFLGSLLGHVRGGLSYVLIGAMYLVSGISGSKTADMAAVAPALFPEMIKRGSKPGDLVALLSATGAQTETVPPSLVLITIGSVTGISIAALFTGGLVPSVVLAIALCFVVRYRYRHEDMTGVTRASWSTIGRACYIAIPALLLPFIIRFCVVEGIATATEVSVIGIVYTILIGLFVYRQFDWKRVVPMLVATASLSGAVLLILGGATAMAWALTQSGFSQQLASLMTSLPGGGYTFLAVSIVAFIVFGSVLEGIPAIVLFGPLLVPIATQLGIHPVHYAMVVVLAMGIGLFAPPFGIGFYTAAAIGGVDPNLAIRPILGYLAAIVLGLIVVALVPWLSIGFL